MLVGLIFLLLLKMQYFVVDRRISITGLLLQLISFGGVTDKTFVVLCLNLSNLGLIPNRSKQKKKKKGLTVQNSFPPALDRYTLV